MKLHLLFDAASAIRLAVAVVLSGGVLLLQARFLFGPFPKGHD